MNSKITAWWPFCAAALAALCLTSLLQAAAGPGDLPDGTVLPPATHTPTWRAFPNGTDRADFYVDNASQSIQDAIDDAKDWGIIALGEDQWGDAPLTWSESLDFQGKAIWLISLTRGVTIQGNVYAPAAMQQSGTLESPAALRLTNIRFAGGSGAADQCLDMEHTALEVDNCVFQDWALDAWTPGRR